MTTVQDQARPRTPTTFWIAWSIDLIAALILVYFFFVGLADGSVSSFNAGLWLLILGAAAVVVGGGFALKATRPGMATMLAMVAAIPCTLLGLFFLVIILVPARWN
jgi:hypothetical protein